MVGPTNLKPRRLSSVDMVVDSGVSAGTGPWFWIGLPPAIRQTIVAKSYLKIMEDGPGFSKFMWDFVDGRPKVNHFKTTASVPASTPVSIKLSKELASRGFKFVGPTIVYAFMQATGMVNDHLVTCFCHENCAGKKRAPRLKAK